MFHTVLHMEIIMSALHALVHLSITRNEGSPVNFRAFQLSADTSFALIRRFATTFPCSADPSTCRKSFATRSRAPIVSQGAILARLLPVEQLARRNLANIVRVWALPLENVRTLDGNQRTRQTPWEEPGQPVKGDISEINPTQFSCDPSRNQPESRNYEFRETSWPVQILWEIKFRATPRIMANLFVSIIRITCLPPPSIDACLRSFDESRRIALLRKRDWGRSAPQGTSVLDVNRAVSIKIDGWKSIGDRSSPPACLRQRSRWMTRTRDKTSCRNIIY